jgi:O-acetyl-ADP-ribose deacetylase (regulator of RNase III)
MLIYVHTSLLESDAQVVVNTVNTVGVMGKGLAAAFKKRYPEMFDAYKVLCDKKLFKTGQLWLWKSPAQWVLNFPTKQHWQHPSKMLYIEDGLKKLADQYEERGIREISFPRLGCGNGGLDWNEVRPLMEHYLAPLPITVYIHDYEENIGRPEHSEISTSTVFVNSFASFLDDLRNKIIQNNGVFYTLSAEAKFHASFNDNGELEIERNQPNPKRLSREDLYEVWSMLIRSPITSEKLIGKARDEAPYILSLIASLPYVRPIKIRTKADEYAKQGIELLDSKSKLETVPQAPENIQGRYEWA